jgi:DNA-binding IclR family transcriptional regulator
LALSIAHLLIENKSGLTATELAEMLHLSVPTLYRITLEMHQQRFLISKRQGRKNVFKISSSIQDVFNSTSSKLDQLSLTKSVLQDYNISLSPRVAETMVVSVIKQKIKEHLPQRVRHRNVGPLNTVLNESVRFDLYLGNDETYVAIGIERS